MIDVAKLQQWQNIKLYNWDIKISLFNVSSVQACFFKLLCLYHTRKIR